MIIILYCKRMVYGAHCRYKYVAEITQILDWLQIYFPPFFLNNIHLNEDKNTRIKYKVMEGGGGGEGLHRVWSKGFFFAFCEHFLQKFITYKILPMSENGELLQKQKVPMMNTYYFTKNHTAPLKAQNCYC